VKRGRAFALAGATAGLAAGVVAERLAVRKRRRVDPEAGEKFGERRGERSRMLDLGDGGRLFVEEVGPARAKSGAIFIHGSVLRTDLWHYQMAGIDDRRLIFYDMRGHGMSQPKGDTEFSVPTLAKDLELLIDDCGLDEVVLIGHSIGGMVALEFAASRAELLGSRVKGLVISNATYKPPVETVAGGATLAQLDRLARRPFEMLGPHSSRIDSLRKVIKPSDALFWAVSFSAFGPHSSAKQIDFTYDMLADTPSDTILDLFKAYRGFSVEDRLGDINVPTLIIAGSKDRITMPEASEHMVRTMPKAQLEMLEGCGHMTMLERHEEFNKLVAAFLQDNLGPPPKKRAKK
jgi:pimeloyl-ACP methyl ester carboxylesterase